MKTTWSLPDTDPAQQLLLPCRGVHKCEEQRAMGVEEPLMLSAGTGKAVWKKA